MRLIPNAILTICGVLLPGCTDGADQTPTEPLSPITLDATRSGSDMVAGAGKISEIGVTNRFNVAARGDPLVGDPRGHVRFEVADVVIANGPVRCLLVVGNRAVVGADRTDVPPGDGTYLVVQDHGNPGEEVPDMGNFAVGLPPDEAGCAYVLAFVQQLFPIDGNVTVRDADPSVP